MPSIINSTKYRLKRYYSICDLKQDSASAIVTLGTSSRTRRTLKFDVQFLPAFEYLLEGASLDTLEALTPDVENWKLRTFVAELADSSILEPLAKTPDASFSIRHDRSMLFYDMIFGSQQPHQEISSKTICLVGVGGIGCWVAYGLASIGVRKLILVDGDVVEESNLSRQILYSPSSLGKPKVEAARDRLRNFNPELEVSINNSYVTAENDCASTISSSDFVVLSADKPPGEINRILQQCCGRLRVPACTVGYCDEIGIAGPIIDSENSTGNPQPKGPENQQLNRMRAKHSFQAPSFGPVNATMSALFTIELVKYFVDKGICTIYGASMLWDPVAMRIEFQQSPYL